MNLKYARKTDLKNFMNTLIDLLQIFKIKQVNVNNEVLTQKIGGKKKETVT